MSATHTSDPKSAYPGPSTLLIASSLVATLLNVAVSFLVCTTEQQYVSILFANVAATLFFLLVLHFVGWHLIQRPLNHWFSLRSLPSLIALSLSILTFSLLYPLLDYSFSYVSDLAAALTILVSLLVPAVYVLGYLTSLRWVESPRFHRYLSHLTVSAPLAAAATLGFVWALELRINIRDNSTGLPTPGALIALLLYMLVLAAVWALSRRLGGIVKPGYLLLGLLAILAAPTIPYLLQGRFAWKPTPHDTSGSKPKHVVLITVDTLRADALGTYNRESRLTPHIDKLATESLVFLNARSASPWTKPAMASILTGLSPLVHRALSPIASLGGEITTLAEMLREEGFATAAIGRNSNLSSVFQFDQGFETYRMYLGSAVLTNPSFGSRLLEWTGLGLAKPSTERLANSAQRWLRMNSTTPFFLWVHLFDPHAPYAPPRKWLPQESGSSHHLLSFDQAGEVRQGTRVLSANEKRRVRELYDAEVRMVDDAVGELLDGLRELGLFDDSLVVFTSDHGEEFFEHGGIAHGHTLYDEVLRVPLLVKPPRAVPPGVVEAPVSTESITPTILELVGAPVDSGLFSSAPLSSFWQSQPETVQLRPIVSTGMLFYEERVAVVFDQWKYIRFRESGREELYHLEDDPGEHLSVAASQPEVLQRARALLNGYFEGIESLAARNESSSEDTREPIPKAVMEDLKALGYLQ